MTWALAGLWCGTAASAYVLWVSSALLPGFWDQVYVLLVGGGLVGTWLGGWTQLKWHPFDLASERFRCYSFLASLTPLVCVPFFSGTHSPVRPWAPLSLLAPPMALAALTATTGRPLSVFLLLGAAVWLGLMLGLTWLVKGVSPGPAALTIACLPLSFIAMSALRRRLDGAP